MIKKIILIKIFFLSSCFFYLNSLKAQDVPCGTEASPEDVRFIKNIEKLQAKKENSYKEGDSLILIQFIDIPIKIHIVIKETKQGNLTNKCGLSQTDLLAGIEKTNDLFSNSSGIKFFMCGDIDYIYNNDFYDWKSTTLDSTMLKNDQPNVINVYFVSSINIQGKGGIQGYSYGVGKNRVLVKNATMPGGTLAHELGHALGLLHTHGNNSLTCQQTTDELVNGSNCKTSGDGFCDTPADPNLGGICSSLVDPNCTYTGTLKDKNGQYYKPLTNNIMSYTRDECRKYFTVEQVQRMQNIAQQLGLFCCDKNIFATTFISEDIISNKQYQVSNIIDANNSVLNKAVAVYKAGQEINLHDGFHAIAGSDFNAYISNCNGTKKAEQQNPVTGGGCLVLVPLSKEITVLDKINPALSNPKIYPNPTVSTINISYELKENAKVTLEIFDLQNRKVLSPILNKLQLPGEYLKQIHIKNLVPGTYIYRLQLGNKTTTGKLIKL